MGLENPFGMISWPDESTTYHLWDRFAPHSWCVADSHIPFASLLSHSAPQVVIWRGYAGRLIIPKGFSNPTVLYRQDYYNPCYRENECFMPNLQKLFWSQLQLRFYLTIWNKVLVLQFLLWLRRGREPSLKILSNCYSSITSFSRKNR